jgi:IS5 family transposase
LIKSGKLADLWRELQRQIDEKGYIVKEGSIQDATFITSDPGRKRKKKDQEAECKKEDKDSEAIGAKQVQEVDKCLLDIANNIINGQEKSIGPDKEPTNEGNWAKKGAKSFFGYKGHILIDTDRHLIRAVETTTASVHDSQVDLGIKGIPRYADKAFDGAETRGYNAAMKKATRGHKLGIRDILRNKRISKKRSHIERCFAVMKRAHKAGHVSVTTVARAGIKFMMSAFVYNIVQLKHLAHNSSI